MAEHSADSNSAVAIDRLAGIFARVRLSARVIHTGRLCGTAAFGEAGAHGHLHVLREGRLHFKDADGAVREVAAPALVLYPRPHPHGLEAQAAGAELVCAEIALGGPANPLLAALPAVLVLALDQRTQGLNAILEALFLEVGVRHCGRQVVMDRLVEAALVHVLRHAMEGWGGVGLLAGLAHPHLARALTALHDDPAQSWTLENLADRAGLSRSVFAQLFHRVVGQTPGQYLTGWRLTLAREALADGRALKQVAGEVGYASPAALSRAFSRHFGTNAREVLREAT